MLYPIEGTILARARTRDFYALAWALSVASHRDVEFARSQIAYVNSALAKNAADMRARYEGIKCPPGFTRMNVPEDAYAPIEIVDAIEGEEGRVHIQYRIPGYEPLATVPVLPSKD